MGKIVGVNSSSQKQVEMKGVLGKHIGRYLDQYTFICVFGSVVGYAVMPLIGTVETLVLSVIVIGLSIHGLRKSPPRGEDDRRRYREERRTKKQDSKKTVHVQVITDSESQQKRQKDDVTKSLQEQKFSAEEEETEKLRRLEEKREKKAKKKGDRNKRREEEKKEKEKEELVRKEKQEQRALKKQQEKEAKGKPRGFLFPTYETIKAMVTPQKPVRRERQHSTSSTSSGSSFSHRSHPHTPLRPHPVPIRASSDPLLYPSSKPSPWGPKTSESATNMLPQPPSNGQLWTTPASHAHTFTSSTSHTDVWQRSDLAPRPPQYAMTATHDSTWSNVNSLHPSWTNTTVETLTPGQASYPRELNSCLLLNGHDHRIWRGNEQQNGGVGPLVAQNSRFYSLFSSEVSSPLFMDFQPSGGGGADHVIGTELDNSNLASTSTEDDPSFDEWPNI